jgi:hypothetical protein
MVAEAMTAFVVHANLDCEAVWGGAPLPPKVARRVSYYAALLAALAPEGAEVEVWAPAAVEPARLLAPPPWRAPVMRVGAPPRADARWADPGARAANDRRLARAVAEAHGAALPGPKVIAAAGEIELPGPGVCKAPWTAAGRDRCRGAGAPTAEQRTRIERLLARCDALVLEPWCDRIVDVGVCTRVLAFSSAGGGSVASRSIAHRNAARVLPDPVGASTSVCSPAAIAFHPLDWAGVGASNDDSKQSRTGGEMAARLMHPRLRGTVTRGDRPAGRR